MGVTWNNQPGNSGSFGSRSILWDDWVWYDFDVTAREEDAASSSDAQLVSILNKSGQQIERLLRMRQNDQKWLPFSFEIIRFRDQTIRVYAGVFNNGLTGEGITSMYIDNVSLVVCTVREPEYILNLPLMLSEQ